MDDATIALIRTLVIEHYTIWGSWPSVAELRAKLASLG